MAKKAAKVEEIWSVTVIVQKVSEKDVKNKNLRKEQVNFKEIVRKVKMVENQLNWEKGDKSR